MKSIIMSCDFMGYAPSLYIEGHSRYKSIFTGILSIIISIFGILCTGYFGLDFINRSTPFVLENREAFDNFGPLNFSNKGFMFLFGIEFENYTLYTDPTVFQVSAFSIVVNTKVNEKGQITTDTTIINLKTDLCSNFYTQEDIIEKNMLLPLDKYYCIEPDKAIMSGFWGSLQTFSITKIVFNKCTNSTENSFNCKSIDKIDELIQNGYISIKFTTNEVNSNNYTQPLVRTFVDEYNVINANSSMEYSVEIYPNNFNSDSGLIFHSIDNYEGIDNFIRVFNKFSRSNNIFSATFQGASVGKTYIRSYVKLQTVLTQIGGFIKAMTLIGDGLSLIISKNLYFSYFLMKLVESDLNPIENFSNNLTNVVKSNKRIILPKSFVESNIEINNLNNKNHPLKFNSQNDKPVIKRNVYKKSFSNLNKLRVENFINISDSPPKSFYNNDLHETIAKKIKNRTVTFILLDYIFNKILLFKKKTSKSLNYKVLNSLTNFYKNVLSIKTIMNKEYEIEYLKAIISKTSENTDIINKNKFTLSNSQILNTLINNMENETKHETDIFNIIN